MAIPLSAIRRHVGEKTLSKGKAYERQGLITNIMQDGHAINGSVQGSSAKPYKTMADVQAGLVTFSDCSCPVGYACKHVAALLLAWNRSSRPMTQTAPRPQNSSKSEKNQLLPNWAKELQPVVATSNAERYLTRVDLLLRICLPELRPWDDRRGNQERRLEIRPRLRYTETNKTTLTNLQWKDLRPSLSIPYELRAVDPKAAGWIRACADALNLVLEYDLRPWMPVTSERARAVWHQLREHAIYGVDLYFESGKTELPVRIGHDSFRTLLVAKDGTGSLVLSPETRLNEQLIDVPVFGVGHPRVFGLIEPVMNAPSVSVLEPVILRDWRCPTGIEGMAQPITIPDRDRPAFEAQFLPRLMRQDCLDNQTTTMKSPLVLIPSLMIKASKKSSGSVAVGLSCALRYGDTSIPLDCPDEAVRLTDETTVWRDLEAERRLQGQLTGLTTVVPALRPLVLNAASAAEIVVKNMDAARTMTALRSITPSLDGITLEQDADLPEFVAVEEQPIVELAVEASKQGHDWFDLRMTTTVDGVEIPFASVFTALSQNEEVLFLEDGRYVSLQTPALAKLRAMIKQAAHLIDPQRSGLQISRYQAGWWDELQALGIVTAQAQAWEESVQALLNVRKIKVTNPSSACLASLRPYQQDGCSWMAFLHRHGLGGVLADEMGLGKTVQSIACLTAAIKEHKVQRPFLIVAPTSVVENWDTELERFAPTLKRIILRSGDRSEAHRDMERAQVVVTSYPLLQRDHAELQKIDWEMILLDEAQVLKNFQSKSYACVRSLQAKTRIALTGTPMENNLMELWSLFSIVSPGLLPPTDKFRETFQRPIEKEQSKEALERLRASIRPFMLRRSKQLVEKDLPAKTEQIIMLDMVPEQRQIYDVYLQRERARVLQLLAEGGMRKHSFEILTSLMRLRQLCLHPGLVDAKYAKAPSAKLDALAEYAGTIVAEGHKALIFSQFTSFLDLAKQRATRAKWPHVYLDGSTKKHQEVVRRFQTDPSIPLFLISLKAGGVGLNLTAAEYCILLDPWWNPAVEAQAIDRTHRIGQTKPVVVYRFLIKNSIEEKVAKLQDKKRQLFKNVMDDGQVFGSLMTEKDIRDMLDAG